MVFSYIIKNLSSVSSVGSFFLTEKQIIVLSTRQVNILYKIYLE